MAWPAAGPSTTITSHSPGAFQLLDLAEHDDVVDARRGRADHVDHTGRRRRLAMRAKPCSRRYSSRARARRCGGPRRRAGARRAWACRRARRPAREDQRPLRRARELPLPWSCRHPPCRPPPPRVRVSDDSSAPSPSVTLDLDSRSPEALVRRLAIALLGTAALLGLAASAATGGPTRITTLHRPADRWPTPSRGRRAPGQRVVRRDRRRVDR
jgi:hypothetical protein